MALDFSLRSKGQVQSVFGQHDFWLLSRTFKTPKQMKSPINRINCDYEEYARALLSVKIKRKAFAAAACFYKLTKVQAKDFESEVFQADFQCTGASV